MITEDWDSLSYEEKNKVLYERQKKMLEEFLVRGAISKAQYEKSLHDLTEKMGMKAYENRMGGRICNSCKYR